MAPKLKTWMKPTKKVLSTRIRKRAQPPLDLLSSDGGATTEYESEPTLRDLVTVFGILTTRAAATEDN